MQNRETNPTNSINEPELRPGGWVWARWFEVEDFASLSVNVEAVAGTLLVADLGLGRLSRALDQLQDS